MDELDKIASLCGVPADRMPGVLDLQDVAVVRGVVRTLEGLERTPGEAGLRASLSQYTDLMGRWWERAPGSGGQVARSRCRAPDVVNTLARHMVLQKIGAVYQELAPLYRAGFAESPGVATPAEAEEAIKYLKAADLFWKARLISHFNKDVATAAALKWRHQTLARKSPEKAEYAGLSLQEIKYKYFYNKFYPFGKGKNEALPADAPEGWKGFQDGVAAIWTRVGPQLQAAKVTLEEATALIAYTSDFYQVMNNGMRATVDEAERRLLVILLKLAVQGLLKLGATQLKDPAQLPTFQNPVVRGDDDLAFLKPRVENAWFGDLGFFSTAMTPTGFYDLKGLKRVDHVLTLFLPPDGGFKGSAVVSFLSYYGSGESEMLFRPGSRFKVLKVLELADEDAQAQWPFRSEVRSLVVTSPAREMWHSRFADQWVNEVVRAPDAAQHAGHYRRLKRVYVVQQLPMPA